MKAGLVQALNDMATCVRELQRCVRALHAAKEGCAELPDLEPYLEPLEEEIRQLRQFQNECSASRTHTRGDTSTAEVLITWRELGQPTEPGPFEAAGIGNILYISQRHIDAATEFGPESTVTLAPLPLSPTLSQDWVIWKIEAKADED